MADEELLQYKTVIDNDTIRFKEIIKKKLISNENIIKVLNNPELVNKGAEPDEYLNVNILPYFLIHNTQTNVQNFICYEVQFDEIARYNKIIKLCQVIFYVLCEQKNNIDEDTGIARHDLLAALIQHEFNWSQCFGQQIHLISDKPSVTDSDYATRTLIFEVELPNGIAKTTNGVTKVINNRI